MSQLNISDVLKVENKEYTIRKIFFIDKIKYIVITDKNNKVFLIENNKLVKLIKD